jgi:predicted 3-demethylubiquinone-9 3-methyltransferase (glyoxalase superfamily)
VERWRSGRISQRQPSAQLSAFCSQLSCELITEAISLFVHCETQDEVDALWTKLTANGGKESQCGWLKDRFGVSWQIVPSALPRLMGDEDPKKSAAVMQAMLKMKKIDIKGLEKAYAAA